jgi:hypothetical protein
MEKEEHFSRKKRRQQQENIKEIKGARVGLVMRHPLDQIQNGWEAKDYNVWPDQ